MTHDIFIDEIDKDLQVNRKALSDTTSIQNQLHSDDNRLLHGAFGNISPGSTIDRKNVNWKNEFIPNINNILDELAEDGEKPSVRGMWYILVSRYPDKIPNIPSMYSSYDKAITKARRGEYGEGKSRLEEDAFVDNVRQIIDIDDIYQTPCEYLQRYIDRIKEAHENYTIPRWYKQPNYVEVWLEKDAVVSMYYSILRNGKIDRQVRIVPDRGWTSLTFVNKNIDRLISKQSEKGIKRVIVLYSGDFDPSGLRMAENLKKELPKHGIEFKMIAITKSQIKDFNLQHLTNPDAKTLAKLEGTDKKKGDSNTEWFKLKHGNGKVYQIELDAMHARREQFKEFLLSTIDQYFDSDIYEMEVKRKQRQESKRITGACKPDD
ncbi:MAG: hypothetical protein ACJ704_08090 [Nitrososphaeraceae archaeon]